MQPVLNIEDVRSVELKLDEYGVSLAQLMYRAGAAVAREVLDMGNVRRVVVFAGTGNNGGDGWVAAEELRRRGARVRVVTPVDPDELSGDLAKNVARSARSAGVEALIDPSDDVLEDCLAHSDIAIDAMLGTGFKGLPREPFDRWIQALNASGLRVVAADVPSGLSAQTGAIEGPCVVADVTVTMIALKPGLLSGCGRDVCGAIVVAPLAEEAEEFVVEAEPMAWRAELGDYAQVLPQQTSDTDKFKRGSVLVVGGSSRYPGAAMMSAMAAARAGAGYVTLAVPASIAPIVQGHMLEVPVVALPCTEDGFLSAAATDMVEALASKCSAALVGPGMGVSTGAAHVVSTLVRKDVPLVIDADGLNCLAQLTSNNLEAFPDLLRRKEKIVLTPHRGELGRLVNKDGAPIGSLGEAIGAAQRIAWANGGNELCVIAKGSATACVGVEATILPKPGPAALATAGSGDVLGGIMAALLAQAKIDDASLPTLCALACEAHGYAGSIAADRFGSRGVIARDIIDVIGVAMDTLFEHVSYPEMAL